MWIRAFPIVLAYPLFASSCHQSTVCELIRRPVVFIGEVIEGGVESLMHDPWHSSATHVGFKVLENLRGLPDGTRTVDVNVTPTSGMSWPNPYYPGRKYLVTPGQLDGKLFEGFCFSGRDVDAASDEVNQVREYFAGRTSSNIHGRVVAALAPYSIDYLLRMGEAKRLEGVRVEAARGAHTYSSVTDASGKYSLALPGPGKYTIRASLEPYVSEPALELSISGMGCEVKDFALSVDNTISGRIWDDRGQPIENAKIGLIDIEQPQEKSVTHVWFDRAYTEQPDGTYRFENVPVGRYLLVFNPDGPKADSPFESTYYPLASSRNAARVIEVRSDTVHLTGMDLIIGTRVDFRQVNVKVRFPDGSPMETAQVRCIGLPSEIEDFPWIDDKVALTSGSAQFSAPANRSLRIEVRDWYARDLKATYASTHEPGTTAITQDFVVKP
jgi:hypothetical protein